MTNETDPSLLEGLDKDTLGIIVQGLSAEDRQSLRTMSTALRDAVDARSGDLFRDTTGAVFITKTGALVLNPEGALYAWGDNRYGQLGIETQGAPITILTRINPPALEGRQISKLWHIDGSTFIQCTDLRLYAWGPNEYGQLGIGTQGESVTTPTQINLGALLEQPVTKIWSNKVGGTFILLENGALYVCGDNRNGQLGIDTQGAPVRTFTPINHVVFGGRPVSELWHSLGGSTFILLENGELYAYGANAYGQLGINTQGAPVTTLTQITLPALGGQPVSKLWRSSGGTFILLENGALYVCGANEYGQLGIGTQGAPVTTPTQITLPALGGQPVSKLWSGFYSTFILLENGALYVCGNNRYGQLGIGTQGVPVTTPTQITLPALGGQPVSKVSKLWSGLDCSTFILLENGALYVCGANEHGQLGINTQGAPVTTPTQITLPALGGEPVSKVSKFLSDFHSTFILLENGALYVCGANEHGQLGINTQGAPVRTFTRIES